MTVQNLILNQGFFEYINAYNDSWLNDTNSLPLELSILDKFGMPFLNSSGLPSLTSTLPKALVESKIRFLR